MKMRKEQLGEIREGVGENMEENDENIDPNVFVGVEKKE
jgi:hypothetical protein